MRNTCRWYRSAVRPRSRELYEKDICHYIKSIFWVGTVKKSEVFGKPSLLLAYYLNSYVFHFPHISETCINVSYWHLIASKTPHPEGQKTQVCSLLYLQSACLISGSSYKAFSSRCWSEQVRHNSIILTRDATVCNYVKEGNPAGIEIASSIYGFLISMGSTA